MRWKVDTQCQSRKLKAASVFGCQAFPAAGRKATLKVRRLKTYAMRFANNLDAARDLAVHGEARDVIVTV
jgi:hypothetical protein